MDFVSNITAARILVVVRDPDLMDHLSDLLGEAGYYVQKAYYTGDAVYAAGKSCRLAALPHLGKANDEDGQGLLLMETDIRQPLNLMVQKGEIDSFELELSSTPEMRALGEAEVRISVNSLKAFEVILEKVYLD